MVRSVLKGDFITPYLGQNIGTNKMKLLTGSHRAAANYILDKLGHKQRIEVIDIDTLDDKTREQIYRKIKGNNYIEADELNDKLFRIGYKQSEKYRKEGGL